MSDDPSRRDERPSTLCDALAESILEMTDAEAVEEAREAGEDPTASANDVRSLLLKTLKSHPAEPATATDDQSDAPEGDANTTTYLLEVRLTRTTRSKKEGATSEEAESRRAIPWMAIAASLLAITVGIVSVGYLLSRPTGGRVEQTQEPPPAATPDDPLPAPPPPSEAPPTPERPAPIREPRPAPRQAPNSSKRVPLETRAPIHEAVPLSEVRTLSVDPQSEPFAVKLRDGFVDALNAGRRIEVVGKDTDADARLRIVRGAKNMITISLVSGRDVIWESTVRADGDTPEEAARLGRELAAKLLDAAAPPD